MPIWGVCCDTEGRDRDQDLRDLGASVSRFVLTAGHGHLPQRHRALRKLAHGVVAKETFEGFGLDPLRAFHTCAQRVRDHWGPQLDYLEIGNEPDDTGGSSYAMSPQQFSDLLEPFCPLFHQGQHEQPILISGGLNSGQPGWVSLVQFPRCPTMLLGLHDYDSRLRGWPDATFGHHDLDFYLDVYRPFWSQMAGVALSEWGHTRGTDDAFGTEYTRRWCAVVRSRPEVKLACRFSLYDWQHPNTPHGLVRNDWTRKAEFGVYRAEIQQEVPEVATVAELEAKIKLLEQQQSLTVDLAARILSGKWHEGADSGEALLRAIAPKYKDFEAVKFPLA